jgi:hypothetical protein
MATPKNNCICQRANDALPSGSQVEPQIMQITQIKPGSTIFPIWSSDARRPLRIRLDWNEPRRHLACLRDLRDLRLKTVLPHATPRSTLRGGKVVDVSPAAWRWPFASARAWFTGMTGPRTLPKS